MRDVSIMDIAMNLARIGNWAADDFEGKIKRIALSLHQTDKYLRDIQMSTYPESTIEVLTRFRKTFNSLRMQTPTTLQERLFWAEDILTWSNILTHKARLSE